MKFLLWGEQLAKTNPGARVDSLESLENNAAWDGLVIEEAHFLAHTPQLLALSKPIAVLVENPSRYQGQHGTICFATQFWKQDSQSVLASFSRFAQTHLLNLSLQKALNSMGTSQSQLVDSTALLVQKLEQHIQIAAEIQKSLLPTQLPKIPGISLSARFFPSHGVGGDYYDIFEFGDKKRFGFLLADSQTHGMAAALLSALLKLRVEQIREDFSTAAEFLQQLGRHVQSEVPVKAADLHLFYGILDRSSLNFRFATAGALKPFLWRSGKLETPGLKPAPPLNDSPIPTFHENTWSLEPGDYLVLATKGLEHIAAPKSMEAWIEERIRRHDSWPDLLDVQNELAAEAHDMSALQDDITLVQMSIDARVLYLKK